MATVLRSLHFLLVLFVSNLPLAFPENEDQFIYNGFRHSKLHLEGIAEIHPNGLLQLTDFSEQKTGHAFHQFPIRFKPSSSSNSSVSFSTNFEFAIIPESPEVGGDGIAFTIAPSTDFTHAVPGGCLGLFNGSTNGLVTGHIFAIELDTVRNLDLGDINANHVGIDVNDLYSIESSPAGYTKSNSTTYFYGGKDMVELELNSGNPMHLWIEYDDPEKLLNVTLAPAGIPRPKVPLLSRNNNLSKILLEYMYVGFSSATGGLASGHYILGWSFNTSGPAQSLNVSSLPPLPNLPPVPQEGEKKEKSRVHIVILLIAAAVVLITIPGAVYILRRKKCEEVREDWEEGYGAQRFSHKVLHKATRGFKDTELLGAGGFGKVYRGTLPSSNVQVAVKKVSNDSKQGMKEFVAEIVSMGRMRHRNLLQLLGYCRRKRELFLVYDYMPNGSLDKFLYRNKNLSLNWPQRFRIIRGVASGLLYLHEEWEQVVLHRDIKASNVLLDTELNARLGDFGLAKLYNHGSNPQTTSMVGTIGYLAPELLKARKTTTCTDVYAFGTFMLEVACGRRPIEHQGLPERVMLVDWVFECWSIGAILDACDPRLEGNYVEEEMVLILKVGLLCSHAMPSARPNMKQVVQFLDGDTGLPELTKERASFLTIKTDESSDVLPSQISTPPISALGSFLNSGR